MSQNIIVQFLIWHFLDVPKELLKAWKNYLRFYAEFFSIGHLLKTLVAPWHGLSWGYGRGFSPARYFETIVSNGFSRTIGAMIRLLLIIIGIVFEIIVFVLGLVVIISWILLPIVLVGGFIFGIKLLIYV
jgi:hypothetical protein